MVALGGLRPLSSKWSFFSLISPPKIQEEKEKDTTDDGLSIPDPLVNLIGVCGSENHHDCPPQTNTSLS